MEVIDVLGERLLSRGVVKMIEIGVGAGACGN